MIRSFLARSSRAVGCSLALWLVGCVPLPPPVDLLVSDGGSDGGGVARDGGASETVDAGSVHDAGATVDAGATHDAATTSDASVRMDAGVSPPICGVRTFDCSGVSPNAEQPAVPGTRCCCEWGLAPIGNGDCG